MREEKANERYTTLFGDQLLKKIVLSIFVTKQVQKSFFVVEVKIFKLMEKLQPPTYPCFMLMVSIIISIDTTVG